MQIAKIWIVSTLCFSISLEAKIDRVRKKPPGIETMKDQYFLPFINQIMHDIKPRGIVSFFVDSGSSNNNFKDHLTKLLFQYSTLLTLDFEKIMEREDIESLVSIGVNFLTRDFLYVFLVNHVNEEDQAKQTVYLIKNLAEVIWRQFRPKSIIVIMGNSSTPSRMWEIWIKRILVYCLEFKMVDLSVIYFGRNHFPILYTYNLFFDKLSKHELLNSSSKIFPDKLINNNGYKFFFGSRRSDLQEEFENMNNFDGYLGLHMKPGDYLFIRDYFGILLNFSVVYVELTADFYDEIGETNENLATVQVLDMVGGIFRISSAEALKYITLSDTTEIEFNYALIPTGKSERTMPVLPVFMFLLVTTLISLLLYGMAKMFKLTSKCWNILNIYSGLLGSAMRIGSSCKDRLIYLYLIAVSFEVSNELLSIATELELSYTEKRISDYKDLRGFNVTVASFNCDATNDESFFLELGQNINCYADEESSTYCIEYLLIKNDRICIMTSEQMYKAATIVRHRNPELKNTKIRFTDFPVATVVKMCLFGSGSPYVFKFNKFVFRCYGMGILRTSDQRETAMFMENHDSESDSEGDFTPLIVYVLLSCGLGSSVLLFLGEMAYYYRKQILDTCGEALQKFRFAYRRIARYITFKMCTSTCRLFHRRKFLRVHPKRLP